MTTTPPTGSAPEDPEAEPGFVDKRRIDPVTGQVRQPSTPQEDVVAEAEAVLAAADDPQDETERLAAERLDQLQRLSVDYLNLQDQYSAYVKRSKTETEAAYHRGVAALAEGLIPVLDDLALARQHDDLTGPSVAIADKLEQILTHHGLVRYGETGEEFDPAIHEALMHGHSADVTVTTVQQVLQPGYRIGERVVRPARVAVVDPQGE